MLNAGFFLCFIQGIIDGCIEGRFTTLDWLYQENSVLLGRMFLDLDIKGEIGYLESIPLFDWFKNVNLVQFNQKLDHAFYPIYNSALKHGDERVLNWLKTQDSTRLGEEFNHNYSFFIHGDNQVAGLNWFKMNYATQYNEKLSAESFIIFMSAITSGNIDRLKWLETESPDSFKRSLQYDDFAAYTFAVDSPQTSVVNYLNEYAKRCNITIPAHVIREPAVSENQNRIVNRSRVVTRGHHPQVAWSNGFGHPS